MLQEMGVRRVIGEIGVKSVIDELSPDERHELKQWLDETTPEPKT